MQEELNSQYWDHLYREQQTAWDIGYVSTPLKEYFDQLPSKDISILIPGCGNSYEAEYLLKNGFSRLTIIDISPLLTDRLKKRLSQWVDKELTIVTGDFFEHKGEYELVVEQTFFCALNPSLRTTYVERVHSLLKPGGKLAGVLFDRSFDEGPPFGGSRTEYVELFKSHFEIKTLAICYNSIGPRQGTELFMIMKQK